MRLRRTSWKCGLRAHPKAKRWYDSIEIELSDDIVNRSPGAIKQIESEIFERISAGTGIGVRLLDEQEKAQVRYLHTGWFGRRAVRIAIRWAGAAAIIILFGIGAYLWNNNKPNPQGDTATIKPYSNDISPGGQRATLTLDDGRTIVLDSAMNGELAIQSGSAVRKNGHEIIYDAGQVSGNAITYNTMTTPKGGQYQLTLSDGTKVWLNAASSIKYPTVFKGDKREVEVAGEVYFEVAANKTRPFVVKNGLNEIVVLGTSFNINAYIDEPAFKTSLIDGVIKVNNKILQPRQAYVSGKIIATNVEQDIAWKNGLFHFERTGLQEVMRQLSRWYDVDIIYERYPEKYFDGEMDRGLTLVQALKILNQMGVQFRVEDRKLIVL